MVVVEAMAAEEDEEDIEENKIRDIKFQIPTHKFSK